MVCNRLTQSADGLVALIPNHPAFVLGQYLRSGYDKISAIAGYVFGYATNSNQNIETEKIDVQIDDDRLNKKNFKVLGIKSYEDLSSEEIQDRLLSNLMACYTDPQYRNASRLLFSEGCSGVKISEETIEDVRKLMEHACRSKPVGQCSAGQFSTLQNYQVSLSLLEKDLTKIDRRLPGNVNIYNRAKVSAMRKLLDLQRQHSDTHYLFSHGMSRMHPTFPKFISELDHHL